MPGALTRSALLALGALALAGCAATTIRSGRAPGAVARGYDERWQSAFVFGAFPATREHDLSRICPGGWAEIRLEPDALTGFAGAVTLFLYSPSRVTVVCAAAPAEAGRPPPLESYPPPGR